MTLYPLNQPWVLLAIPPEFPAQTALMPPRKSARLENNDSALDSPPGEAEGGPSTKAQQLARKRERDRKAQQAMRDRAKFQVDELTAHINALNVQVSQLSQQLRDKEIEVASYHVDINDNVADTPRELKGSDIS